MNLTLQRDAVGYGRLRPLPVTPPGDLDQTALSVVRLVPPSGELDDTYASSLILA